MPNITSVTYVSKSPLLYPGLVVEFFAVWHVDLLSAAGFHISPDGRGSWWIEVFPYRGLQEDIHVRG